VLAYLLATLVHRTAVRGADYAGSVETLFTELSRHFSTTRPRRSHCCGARPAIG